VVRRLALVFSGGGARGALQVGAVRALLEAGYTPKTLVGTSIGAANAAFLALHGVDQAGLEALQDVYRQAAADQILSPDYLRLYLRALVKRPVTAPFRQMREIFIRHGLTPQLRFGDLEHTCLLVVATDLNQHARIIYGLRPDELVLDAVLASTALPPWVAPIDQGGRLLMDGGLVSNIPIEPALAVKPTEIIALDVKEQRDIPEEAGGFGVLFNKFVNTIQKRQFDLEMALAAAEHVPVRYIHLQAELPVPIYAFDRWEELVAMGYQQTVETIQSWQPEKRAWWRFWKDGDA
jgi:NTE family protein